MGVCVDFSLHISVKLWIFRSKIPGLTQQDTSVQASDKRKNESFSTSNPRRNFSKYRNPASPAQYSCQASCVSYRGFFCTLPRQKLRAEANEPSSASYTNGFSLLIKDQICNKFVRDIPKKGMDLTTS